METVTVIVLTLVIFTSSLQAYRQQQANNQAAVWQCIITILIALSAITILFNK